VNLHCYLNKLTETACSGCSARRASRRQRCRTRPEDRPANGPHTSGGIRFFQSSAQLHSLELRHSVESLAVRRTSQSKTNGRSFTTTTGQRLRNATGPTSRSWAWRRRVRRRYHRSLANTSAELRANQNRLTVRNADVELLIQFRQDIHALSVIIEVRNENWEGSVVK